jgi:hypothetical protein
MKLKGDTKYKDTKTMKTHPLYCISIILFISCSSTTRIIQHTESAYKEVNQELKGEAVTIEKMNGEEVNGEYVRILPDSVSVVMEKIAIENVKAIKFKNYSKGAIAGMGLGFLSGFLIGGFIGYLTSEDEQPTGTLSHMELGGVSEGAVFGVGGALAGLLVGGIYGGVSGVTDKFIFPSPEMESRQSKSTIRVEYTKIVKKGRGYLIILWQGKEIRLSRVEYNYLVESDDGKQLIVVPEEVYLEKFQ